ncbi:hypothetical protein GCM10010329_46170 [Streptomyces spiroverticillatus]|uniref:Uncharacterized protein n=1 Tax=Streptomyces finlayi TaxID=67296 RepID=A0A918WZX3_9ACTN|nr:hypothetical protein [Streptomyces finlayi]GHA17855.1 hypothetical protein GCM10010329_46170 [Streptomyces spiroverticillatus]GHC99605.1 hypothetical protein GCM10010334_43340 [Streptomyces finlayi]
MSSTSDVPPPPGPDEETLCRVCGLDDGSLRWEGGWPTHDICDCCGHETDISDVSVEHLRHWRGYWAGQGARWSSPGRRPAGWNIFEQLAAIPEEWR